jgi:hypothetical protein
MSEEMKTIIDASFDNGTPIWLHTRDYIFGMVPADSNGERWTEISYTYEDPDEPLSKTERSAELSFQFLMEEVEKGVSFYIEDLKIPLIKDFAKSLEDKSGPEKIKAFITELITNSATYSSNFPIIKGKGEVDILKEKIP